VHCPKTILKSWRSAKHREGTLKINIRSRAYLRGAAGAILCAGMAAMWGSHAAGQDAESRAAEGQAPAPAAASPAAAAAPAAPAPVAAANPAPEPPVSFLVKPATGNVTNSQTDRMNDADRDNWRLHGRTYDSQRFSPLTQINKTNVKKLRPVAMIQTGVPESMEATPLVIDGVMYVETARDVVQAYDAVTGELFWSYTPVLEKSDVCCGPQARGVAVSEGKVFVAQLDGHIVALDAKTGKVIWKTVNSELLPAPTHWYPFTSAPQVHDGLVLVGNTGAEWPTRGFFAALDENTGKLVWRFWLTAGPDDPNFKGAWEGESWKIGGGSVWDAASIDKKNDLVIFAVGNPNPDLYGENRKGNNLYTNSIVALHIKTGKLAWHYQEVPHDVWDFDAASPVLLFDTLDAKGRKVPAAGEANKNGRVYIVNRLTGEFIRQTDAFGLQIKDTYMVPPGPVPAVYAPGNHGGPMWQPPSYSPNTHYFYTLGSNQANIYKVRPMTPWVPGSPEVGIQYGNLAATPDERKALASQIPPPSGYLVALNADTGKIAWQYDSKYMMFGGVLTTASDLLFTGEPTGDFLAFDAKSGKKLWSYNMGVGVCTPPITYRVKGVQYVAVGAAGCHYLENQMKAEGRAIFGDTIAIFALPRG
jgi:glucose dehydrogenase